MLRDPHFSLQKSSPLLISLIFRKKKIWPWEVVYFLVFRLKKGQICAFRDWVWQAIFPLECYILPNGMTPVTKIYLKGFFTSITNQKCLLHQFIFIFFYILKQPKPNGINRQNFYKYCGLSYRLFRKRAPWPPNFFASLTYVSHYLTAVKVIQKSDRGKIFARTSF